MKPRRRASGSPRGAPRKCGRFQCGRKITGDEEREDLTEIATIATLEIAPAHASEGWLLAVVVEDEVGPRMPNEGGVTGGEQQIDLGTFYNEFIRPGRGSTNVTAEVEGPAAQGRLTRLLNTIESNRHTSDRGARTR